MGMSLASSDFLIFHPFPGKNLLFGPSCIAMIRTRCFETGINAFRLRRLMKVKFFPITMICILLLYVPDALAGGFGYYGTFGAGKVKYKELGGSYRENSKFIGGGLVFDTAVAKDNSFNYRFSVGYEKLTNDFDRLESIVIDQDFGLAIHRSAHSRIWFGPELRIFFSNDEIGMGIGPVLGINLHTGRSVTAALKMGVLFSDFFGGNWVFSTDYENESHAFINLAILFRSDKDKF
jgi:hypothetical protein